MGGGPDDREGAAGAYRGAGGGGGSVSGGAGGAYRGAGGGAGAEEIEMQEDDILMEPVPVTRYVLLTEDAKKRYKMRQMHKQIAQPVEEPKELPPYLGPDGKIVTTKLHNFSDLLDSSQIIRASSVIKHKDAVEVLPFVAVMAVVTSYKYSIDTWTKTLVDFVVDAGKKLSDKKIKEFQACSLHILPKIAIGHEDIVHDFCQNYLPHNVFHMMPEDVTYMRGFLKPKLLLCSHFWSIQQRLDFSRQDLTERLRNNKPVFRALQAKLDGLSERLLS